MLNTTSLKQIRENKNIQAPNEAVTNLPEKIIQFGTGAFLRGFIEYFINNANNHGKFNGRIVCVQSTGSGRANTFKDQDYLFTNRIEGVQDGKTVQEFVVNASLSRSLSAKEEWSEVLKCAENEQLEVVVSNTTEVGIQYKEESIHGNPPESFPAKLTALLYARFKHFKGDSSKGMTVIPCELLVDNGNKLRDIVYKICELNKLEAEFIAWLKANVTFCNSLVDRIVPGNASAEKALEFEKTLGYKDSMLTVSEVYRLWAIEGGKDLKKKLEFYGTDSGIIITEDIAPFRERKLRLLNGSHTISVALGYLYGLETVSDCMEDPFMGQFFEKVILEEIAPSVPVDQASCEKFGKEVLDRYRNPFLNHQLLSICLQYSMKMRMRNAATFVRYYEKFEKLPELMCLGFAAFLVFEKTKVENGKYFGERDGKTYEVQDDQALWFSNSWKDVNTSDKASVLSFVKKVIVSKELWHGELNAAKDLAEKVSGFVFQILNEGAKSTLQKALK